MSDQCSICFEDLNINKRKATTNKCQHAFCLSCIEEWARRKNSCPYCRTNFDVIKVGGKRKRDVSISDFRKSIHLEHEKSKQKLRKYMKKNVFDCGFVLRQSNIVYNSSTAVQEWEKIPKERSKPGDITSLDIMLEKNMCWVDEGSRCKPIEL